MNKREEVMNDIDKLTFNDIIRNIYRVLLSDKNLPAEAIMWLLLNKTKWDIINDTLLFHNKQDETYFMIKFHTRD